MPKYDVFSNPSGDGFLLDVQSDLLSDLNTRVVVPLLPVTSAPKPATRLNPTFDINGERVVMPKSPSSNTSTVSTIRAAATQPSAGKAPWPSNER